MHLVRRLSKGLFLVGAICFFGCSETKSAQDAGSDTDAQSGRTDAGASGRVDAGLRADAGDHAADSGDEGSDGGTRAPDAGVGAGERDAGIGASEDGGIRLDAGAGAGDAGTPGVDAGSVGRTFPITSACPAFAGGSANGECLFPEASADGRLVVFSSDATNMLATPIVNPVGLRPPHRVYVRDLVARTSELVEYDAHGAITGTPYAPQPPSISSDGRYVLYMVPAQYWDASVYSSPNPTLIVRRDRMTSTSMLVSERPGGAVYGGTNVRLSGNGRYVVLKTSYTLTAPTTTVGETQVYVRDLEGDGNAIVMASIGPDSMPASGFGYEIGDVSISDDGRRVVFTTNAANFIVGAGAAGVPTYMKHCYLRDLTANTTTRIDVATTGTTGDWPNGECAWAVVSGDGRYVAYSSGAPNIVSGDTNGFDDVFVRDTMTGTTERVTLSDGGAQITDAAPTVTATTVREIDLSNDGRYVVFLSYSHMLVAGDTATDAGRQAFVRDRMASRTYRYTLHPDGTELSMSQAAFMPCISGDGSTLFFTGSRAGIVPGSSGTYEVFTVPRSAL